jgi:hypothetical protein
MKNTKVLYCFLGVTLFIFTSCNDHNETSVTIKSERLPDSTGLQTGGLYLYRNADSTYSVSKIIAMDDFAVHVRMYSDTFNTKPLQLNSADLHVLVGHSPISKEGFSLDKPELLKIEPVKESELEGYKIYLEEMKK